MNKSELIDAIASDAKLTKKDTEAFLKAFTENVSKAMVKGEDVTLIGFGSFKVGERAARTGRNPKTGKEIKIAALKNVRFKAGTALKDRVNKGK